MKKYTREIPKIATKVNEIEYQGRKTFANFPGAEDHTQHSISIPFIHDKSLPPLQVKFSRY